MIFPHTVTVHPSEQATDTDGNPVRRPTAAGITVAAYVQPDGADQTDAASVVYRVWLAAACPPLDAAAALEWNGVTYELIGAARYLTDPDGAIAFWRARVRRRM